MQPVLQECGLVQLRDRVLIAEIGAAFYIAGNCIPKKAWFS